MQQDPFAPPFQYWNRFYGTINGQVCSWSFTVTGQQSDVICEAPYQPRPDTYQTPITPTIANDPPTFNDNPPVSTVPEPSTVVLLSLGIIAALSVKILRKNS